MHRPPLIVLAGLIVLVGCLASGCALTVAPTTPPRLCADGKPPKLIVQADCPSGVCGYTCAPDRWVTPIGGSGGSVAPLAVAPTPPEWRPVLTAPPVVLVTPLPIKKLP